MFLTTNNMKTAVMAIIMLLGCHSVTPVHAQNAQRKASTQQTTPTKVMRGYVCDETNTPMSGVVVRNLTIKRNVVTDRDGRFTLPCRGAGDDITLSFIGKRTLEAKSDLEGVVNFIMEDDESILGDVVVTGYQTIKRTNATGSFGYVDSKKLVDKTKLYEVDEALQLVCDTAKAKFDETVEAHIRLGVDSRHADQQVRGAVVLPNGTGK